MGLPTILMVAGTAMNVVGNLAEGNAQAGSYMYQSQVADYNERRAVQEGTIAATNKGMETRARVGAIKAGQAASGVDVNTGSAAEIRAAAASLGQLDASTIMSNALSRAFGYKTESKLLKQQAGQAQSMGVFKAVSSLIGGASETFSSFKNWQNTSAGFGKTGNQPIVGTSMNPAFMGSFV